MERIYAIEDKEEVTSWLDCHPGAQAVLQQVPAAVAEFFPDANLRLELRTDSESASDERLGIYIRTGMDPKNAVEQFMALDSTWGDRLHDLTDGGFLLNIEARS